MNLVFGTGKGRLAYADGAVVEDPLCVDGLLVEVFAGAGSAAPPGWPGFVVRAGDVVATEGHGRFLCRHVCEAA